MEVKVKHVGDMKFVVGARRHTLVSDQPTEFGGNDEGMTPPELFLAALGSCAAFYAAAYLKKKGLAKDGVEVRVLAEKAGPPARLADFKIAVDLPLALSEADRGGVERAVHHCLIHQTLMNPPKVDFEFHMPVAA